MIADELLREVHAQSPHLNRYINLMYRGRGNGLPAWPKWCFIPLAGWIAIASKYTDDPQTLAQSAAIIAAVCTWQYSRGIYRMQDDLAAAIAASPPSGNLPATVLYRLPEWCVYVDCSSQKDIFHTSGFFTHLEWDANTSRAELRFLANLDDNFVPFTIHIGPWTVEESIERMFDVIESQAAYRPPSTILPPFVEFLKPLLSVVLYLCSAEPEIDEGRRPGWTPYKPVIRQDRGQPVLVPAERSRFYAVGRTLGQRLRDQGAEMEKIESDGTRRHRPHLRRGHWHGFWRGKRGSEEQEFIYHWLHPLIAGTRSG